MTNLDQDIRRLENGAIDVNFYCRRGRVLRAEASIACIRYLRSHVMRPLLAAAIVVAPLALAAWAHSYTNDRRAADTPFAEVAMQTR